MNVESSEYRRDLVQSIEKWARETPESVALYVQGGNVSFGELNVRSNRVANGLQRLGIAKGDRVALMLPNISEFVYAFLGILKLGAVAVPFNTMYKGGEILHILKDSGAKALIALTNFAPMINEIRLELPNLEHVILTGERNLVFADPEATVFVQMIVELDKLGGVDEAYRKVGQVLLASLEKLGVRDAWYKHRGSIRVRAEKIAAFVISEIEGMAVVNGVLFVKPVDTNTFLRVVWIPPEVRDKVTEPLTCLEKESGRAAPWDLIKDTLVGALEETFQVEITESPMLRDEMFGYEKLRSLAYRARGKQ